MEAVERLFVVVLGPSSRGFVNEEVFFVPQEICACVRVDLIKFWLMALFKTVSRQLLLVGIVASLALIQCAKEPLLDPELASTHVVAPRTIDGINWVLPSEAEELADSLTQLGRLRANPYTVANMSDAYRYLFDTDAPDLPITHHYIEFTPQTWQELGALVDSFTVFDFDLRYEVIHIGQYYSQPGTDAADTEIPKRWGVLEFGTPIPAEFSYTVLADLFLPSPTESTLTDRAFAQVGEVRDGGTTDQTSTANGCWPCCANYPECVGGCQEEEFNFECNECCQFYPDCLYDGRPEPVCSGTPPPPPAPTFNDCGCRVGTNFRTVSGCVHVEDDDFVGSLNVNVPGVGNREVAPVEGLDIIIWNGWYTFDSDHTDERGCFAVDNSWRENSRIHVWTKWKNRNVTIHGWTPGTGSIYRIGVDRYLGRWRVERQARLHDTHIVMTNIGDRESRSQVWYYASHFLNGVERGRDRSVAEGVPLTPNGLRVVMSNNDDGAGAAPMFKSSGTSVAIVFTGCAAAVAFLTPAAGVTSCGVFVAAERLIPDVWQNYGNESPARSGSLSTDVYMHELGHAVHWRGVTSQDWNANVNTTIAIWTQSQLQPNDPRWEVPYGNGTTAGAGWTATIESWAEYFGAASHGVFYGDRWYAGTSDNEIGLEGFIPSAVGVPGQNWIPQGLPLDLEDDASPTWEGMVRSPILAQDDIVGNLAMAGYYAAMTTAGIRPSPTNVRNRINAAFLPPGQTVANFTSTYATYGW